MKQFTVRGEKMDELFEKVLAIGESEGLTVEEFAICLHTISNELIKSLEITIQSVEMINSGLEH